MKNQQHGETILYRGNMDKTENIVNGEKNRLKRMERVKGIEPSYTAWEAGALPLCYTRIIVK